MYTLSLAVPFMYSRLTNFIIISCPFLPLLKYRVCCDDLLYNVVYTLHNIKINPTCFIC